METDALGENCISTATETSMASSTGHITTITPGRSTSRGRICTAVEGVRLDRPCNRDRSELINHAPAKLIIVAMLPLSFVTNEAFRGFVQILEPNFRVPYIQTLTNRFALIYNVVADKTERGLSAAFVVALASKCWPSRSQYSYVTVTALTLDETWNPKSLTLLTEEMNEPHTAANMIVRLQQAIQQWNIDSRVLAIVTNNGRIAMNAMRNVDTHVINEDVTCAAHTLQLSVIDSLKREDVDDIFSKARKVVAHFKHSNIAATPLELKQERIKIHPELQGTIG